VTEDWIKVEDIVDVVEASMDGIVRLERRVVRNVVAKAIPEGWYLAVCSEQGVEIRWPAGLPPELRVTDAGIPWVPLWAGIALEATLLPGQGDITDRMIAGGFGEVTVAKIRARQKRWVHALRFEEEHREALVAAWRLRGIDAAADILAKEDKRRIHESYAKVYKVES
jgi:hypothetical protein